MISNGGNQNGTLIIGCVNTATGTVTVMDAGSSLTGANSITVGSSGDGTLNVQNGASVNRLNITVGSNTSGVGHLNVSGAGTTFTASGNFYVGNNGTGTVQISNGAVVTKTFTTSTASVLGVIANSSGTMTVTGTGSLFDSTGHNFSIGQAGAGDLTVSAGGKVISSNFIVANGAGGGTATITGPTSVVQTTNNTFVGRGGLGTLRVEAGAILPMELARVLEKVLPGMER